MHSRIDYKNIVKQIDFDNEEYPQKLREIQNPPKKLNCIGNMPDSNKKTVAIVGSRNCSDYGSTLAKVIARTLSSNDIQIVSGMALGIDSSAHIGAIENNARNFAILGCGVDICYPTYNFNIYEKIIKTGGGIISELENGTPPLPYNFPLRNRIISGLADIVIVVEAKENSGALITVDYALEQGKDIFAVPGRVGDMLSSGTNNLIKQGAFIFTSVNDIYERLGMICENKLVVSEKNENNLDYFEKVVLQNLSYDSQHIDEIVMKTKLPLEKCINTLMSLQINGFTESTRVNYYRLVS